MIIMTSVGKLLLDEIDNIEEQFKILKETCEDIVDKTDICTDEEDELDSDETTEQNSGLEDNDIDAPNVDMEHVILEQMRPKPIFAAMWVISAVYWCVVGLCRIIGEDRKDPKASIYQNDIGLSLTPDSRDIKAVIVSFGVQLLYYIILLLFSIKRNVTNNINTNDDLENHVEEQEFD